MMNKEIEYILKRDKRKTISISISKNKEVTVKAPLYLSMSEVNRFVLKHTSWIEKKISSIEKIKKQTEYLINNNETLLYGDIYKIVNLDKGFSKIDIVNKLIYLVNGDPINNLYKKEVKVLVEVLKNKYSFYGEAVNIYYKKQKTIWGSCTSKGNININYLLIKAPEEVLEYIYVHELVHLNIKNHSKVFWLEVEKLFPEYKKWRIWLKDNGHLLFL